MALLNDNCNRDKSKKTNHLNVFIIFNLVFFIYYIVFGLIHYFYFYFSSLSLNLYTLLTMFVACINIVLSFVTISLIATNYLSNGHKKRKILLVLSTINPIISIGLIMYFIGFGN